jgi:mannose/fructose/N-acetylgalactosamine-specific phosphotransferase system component IIB
MISSDICSSLVVLWTVVVDADAVVVGRRDNVDENKLRREALLDDAPSGCCILEGRDGG